MVRTNINHPLLEASNQGRFDAEVYRDGECVAMVEGGSAQLIERLVREVREATGQRIDWNYIGGRAVVKALGDAATVREALQMFTLQIHIVH